jgi:Photosynthesis system II assembly factor YCF48
VRVLVCSLLIFSCFGANFSATSEAPVLAFEARGQQYVSHGPGYALSVTSRAAVLNLGGHAVRMSVAGPSPKSSIVALDRMPGRANYLLGSNVRASYDLYGRVRWRSVYPGMDVVFRANQEHLEYDFEIGAGRDPGKIKLSFEGVDDLRINQHGDLVLNAGAVQIHQPKPVAYQVVAGQKQPVDVAFRIGASNHVGFRTGAYDRARPLVIDPQIVFDKSFGGSGFSTATGIARDAKGGLYLAGSTSSTNFATVSPVQSHLGGGPLLVTADAANAFTFPSLGPATSVSAIAASPSTPLVVYAATLQGAFQSADGGTTWAPTAGVGLPATALAVDASSATTLYAATQQGIFVSTDGAASWQPSTNGLTGFGILTIVADPAQTGIVYASVQSPPALFRSTDFGQTWTQLPIAPNPLTSPVNAIAIGSNGAILLATNQGILISTDGGTTWTAGAGLPVQNNQTLAISPDDPSIVYLVNSSSKVQRSTDGGQTFNTVFSSTHLTQLSRVAVDPRNPSTVYVTDYDLLFRSTDGGKPGRSFPCRIPSRPKRSSSPRQTRGYSSEYIHQIMCS